MYSVNIEDGYVHSIVSGVSPENSNIGEEEYLRIKAVLENAPVAADGYLYRLNEHFEWELLSISQMEETTQTDNCTGGDGN